MASLVPALATVRPRVCATEGDSSRLLEEIVEEFADESPTGILWLLGQEGSGKSTALAHLAAVFEGDSGYAFLDDADHLDSDAACADFVSLSQEALVIAARSTSISTGHKVLRLEPWGVDELVEYLLVAHRSQCGEVMQRLGDEARRSWTPEIVRVVLDRLVANPNLRNASSAIRTYLEQELPDTWQLTAARQFCLAHQKGGKALQTLPSNTHSLPPHVKKLLRHELVQLPLAAEQITMALTSRRSPRVLEGQLSLGLVEAVGQTCRSNDEVPQCLEKILKTRRDSKCHAMAASILLAANPEWQPICKTIADDFAGAYFSRANWPEISFANAHLELTEFYEANLAGACFANAILVEADFAKANLNSASLKHALAVGADFEGASLQKADLKHIKLESASLVSADLSYARMFEANLCQADLTNACFRGANLTAVKLVSAKLSQTNFVGCDLSLLDARYVDFRSARLQGACLEQALLTGANFEDVRWRQAQLKGTTLHAAHLTGSNFPAADLRNAELSAACLGEIDWENADLRGANLSGATFHMGSSRSGLVDSPIASEGSRTGFYTDELDELYFKSPEQVRKANLRGADLRGADITNVDFYLVDLRDAKLDPQQRKQVRQSGAILSNDD